MIIENNTPETVREQLFYMDGYIRSLEEDENGYVKIHVDWLIGALGAALQLAHNEKKVEPKISDAGYTYRPPFPAQKGVELEPLKGERCNY